MCITKLRALDDTAAYQADVAPQAMSPKAGFEIVEIPIPYTGNRSSSLMAPQKRS